MSFNLVAINHQVHRGATWRSQILEESCRDKKIKCFILVYKGILYQLVAELRERGKVLWKMKINISICKNH